MQDEKHQLTIRFEGLSLAEAGAHARKLQQELADLQHDEEGQDVESVKVVKDSQETMDFGTTLVLILGTPAVIAVARGVANYLDRSRTSVTIERNGKVVMKNVRGQDIAKIIEAIKGGGDSEGEDSGGEDSGGEEK
jgi:hypothetical protein